MLCLYSVIILFLPNIPFMNNICIQGLYVLFVFTVRNVALSRLSLSIFSLTNAPSMCVCIKGSHSSSVCPISKYRQYALHHSQMWPVSFWLYFGQYEASSYLRFAYMAHTIDLLCYFVLFFQ